MIDPARKPVQAPPTKPTAKPATTRGLIKCARLVFFMFSCISTSTGINTVSPQQLVLGLPT